MSKKAKATNSQTIAKIFRSRKIMLDLAERRGFNIDQYKDFNIPEVSTLFGTCNLDMELTNPETDEKLYFKYHLKTKISKTHIQDYIEDIYNVEETLKPSDNLIIVGKDKPNDTLINVLDMTYKNDQYYVNIYNIHDYLFNILDHTLVPEHRIINESEKKEVEKFYNIVKDSHWPEISRFDPVATAIGIKPGQVAEITRSSPTSLTTKYYRFCK
uniref:RNA polymerase subunit H/Rpb5 C-terminal domain-containing protein n=1 Tax=viral metagenome TaxID=1070528 RepID=A0A6C0KC44_9ZZZZ